MFKENIKILPISSEPFIKTYLFNGLYLGILEANNINIDDVLINEFLNVFYFRARKGGHLDFCGSGYVEKNRFFIKHDIDLETISPEFIINKIDNNYYLMVNLQEKYLGLDYGNCEYDRSHDWMIYGYDDIKKVFFCYGYIVKINGTVFGSVQVKYDDLILSMKKVPISFEKSLPSNLRNHSLKVNFDWNEKVKTKKQLIKKLKKYYHPLKISMYHRLFIFNDSDGIKYFLRAFKKEYIEKRFDYNKLTFEDMIFLPDIRTLYEQKKVFGIILKRLTNEPELIKRQNAVIKSAYLNLLLSFKYNSNPQRKIIEDLYDRMINIELEQKDIVEQLLNQISNS